LAHHELLHMLDLLCVVPPSEQRDVPLRASFVFLVEFPSISVSICIGKKRICKKKAKKPKKKTCFFVLGGGVVGERKENRVKTFGSKKRSDKELALLPCNSGLKRLWEDNAVGLRLTLRGMGMGEWGR
jgi:hypothetical protein